MENATAPAETPSERLARERQAAEARMNDRTEEDKKRGRHLAEEEEEKKAEQEKRLAAAGVDEEIEWKNRWGDAGCTVGVEGSQSRALKVLLSHYPFVLFLGLFFWRTTLIRVWSSGFWGKAGLPPLTGKSHLKIDWRCHST